VRKILQGLQLAFVPLGDGSSSNENQTSICCLSPEGLSQKIEFVISCQSRNNPMGASGAYAPSPSHHCCHLRVVRRRCVD
jgi:hypothetical protein